MKTEAERPKSESLAREMASDSVWKVFTTTTGPKISSFSMVLPGFVFVKMVGLTKKP